MKIKAGMRVAIPTWNRRISPVFDTTSRLLVVEVGEEGEYSRFETDISQQFLPSKTLRLKELGIDTLICGAISGQCAYMVTSAGIELIPWISGFVEEVLQAFLKGPPFNKRFLMPGHPGYWDKGPGKDFGRGRRRRRGVHFP
jgi:predicted Fe-Mo cluster-binding NifX family protein